MATDTRGLQALELVRQQSAQYGVCGVGAVPLGALSRLIQCRGLHQLPATGAVIVLLIPYYTGEHPVRNVSLYAVPDDYHRVAGAILERLADKLRHAFPGAQFQPFVDSSPIPEVEAAQLAGLGWVGRHGQLVAPGYGSMVFICELVTSLAIEPSLPVQQSCCATCKRCIEACPTGALSAQGLDITLCRSQITQKKGELSQWEEQQVACGGLVWGCDICTMACPHNCDLPFTTVQGFLCNLLPWLDAQKLDTQMTEKSYIWRGKAVLRRNLALTDAVHNDERK